MTQKLLYVGAKYDYGDKTRGLSYEHRNFHSSLKSWCARQGCEFEHYDYYTRGQEIGLDLMTQELREVAQKERPTFLFSVLVDFHLDPRHEVFSEISKTGETTTLQWFCDDHWRFDQYSKQVAPHFQFVTTTASSAVAKYAQIGLADRVIKTQWACNHELYAPFDIPQDIDASFVGMPHGDRVAFLNTLAQNGLPISVFGFGWQGRPRLPFHQMVRLFSRSRINLNLSNSSMLSRQQIKGRNFEVPGAGGFLLTGQADNLEEYYIDGREVVIYSSAEDLVDKARYYLAHDSERRQIAQAGCQRTLAEHTWHHRYDKIFHEIAQRTGFATRRGPALSVPKPAQMLWQGPLWEATGWADEARSFVLALDTPKYPIAVSAVRGAGATADLSPSDRVRLKQMEKRSLCASGVSVCHGLPTSFRRVDGARLNIGRTMFETDSLPSGWAEMCNQMDQIWVPSEFNRDTFAQAGVSRNKLMVIPGAIDAKIFDRACEPLPISGARGFNFLSVFDWTLRKGWDCLVQAYVEEFSAGEDVSLIIKPSSSLGHTPDRIASEIDNYIANHLGLDPDTTPDIILEAVDVAQSDMPRLYKAADCYVLPTRGEGWGRPYMEAMAVGLPTIGTDWGGNRAFMTPENSFPIRSRVVPVSENAALEQPMYQGQRWAQPDVNHLRQLMREVFTNRAAARLRGYQARADILQNYSHEAVADLIHEVVFEKGLLAAA